MTSFNTLILSSVLLCGLAACAAPAEETQAKTHDHHATVKPGAAVSMTSVLPKAMTPGELQTIRLNFEDDYDAGMMSVRVVPTTGLSVFGGDALAKEFDMAGVSEIRVREIGQGSGAVNAMDVDVQADAPGIYFLNVFAEAQGQARAFSVRLEVGEVTQKMRDDAMLQNGTLTDDGAVRALDAAETIR